MNNQQLWQAMLGSLEITLSKGNFNTWFKNTGIIERGEDYIIVGVPSTFTLEWIKNKFHTVLLKSLKTLSPEIKDIKYHIGTIKAEESKQGALLQQSEVSPKNSVVYKENGPSFSSNLNKQYTFETFIIGQHNDLAYAASEAVSKNPGEQYNPLFIYGGVAVSYTH